MSVHFTIVHDVYKAEVHVSTVNVSDRLVFLPVKDKAGATSESDCLTYIWVGLVEHRIHTYAVVYY